ncbi:MAG TPA: hypothetical protein VKH35_04745, partial [Thermoanaerobaculia bacterium]|nr:hypothetical protein [Thermoanaerobaculia bacterium]
VVWRDTTEPVWTHSKAVGREPKTTMAGMSKDNFFFGVRAVDRNGFKSVVSSPVPFRPRRPAPPPPAPPSPSF